MRPCSRFFPNHPQKSRGKKNQTTVMQWTLWWLSTLVKLTSALAQSGKNVCSLSSTRHVLGVGGVESITRFNKSSLKTSSVATFRAL
jgi:hypothetical protein